MPACFTATPIALSLSYPRHSPAGLVFRGSTPFNDFRLSTQRSAFVGFQLAEDGTLLYLGTSFLHASAVFDVFFYIAIATFKGFASFSYTNPIGDLLSSTSSPNSFSFFAHSMTAGLLATSSLALHSSPFSVTICNAIKHYIDGLFFFTLCVLLSIMMVYRYWDSESLYVYVFPIPPSPSFFLSQAILTGS
jgi:hypothetical protein